jgi:ribosomal protein L40E
VIRRSKLGPAKVVLGILSIVIGLFITLFGGIAFLFKSFGGLGDLGLLTTGLIFLFVGIWMTLDAFFSDVEVQIGNLDELAAVLGKRVVRCRDCAALNPPTALYCMRCGAKLTR